MIEPLAAVIVNHVLPRTSARRTSALRSAITSMRKHDRKLLPEDFFTPHPRSWKGKERAPDSIAFECTACANSLVDPNPGIRCAARHSLWCPRRNGVFAGSEITPRRLRRTGTGTVPRSIRRHSSSSAPQKHSRMQGHTLETTSSPSQACQDSVMENLSGAMDIHSLLHPSAPFDPNTAWALL
ncbi:hypothetical protein EDD16DRAFT_1081021 [Pisolithus croceorrhizus]|nr:hypothetical protein EDD16DRAFT_1081021 [Pisolithus croceorrhizus]